MKATKARIQLAVKKDPMRRTEKQATPSISERHVQRRVSKRKSYPKRPTAVTHPFETTLDF